MLCCVTVAACVVPGSEGAEASLRDVLAAALDANRELARLTAEVREENERLRAENERLRAENEWLRAENAEQAVELGKLRADLAVLQRMVFGRSSERSRPEPPGGAGDAAGGQGAGTGAGRKRGPGARAGRRDYSHLPRFEVFWDFPGGGYCCPECGEPFTPLGDHWSGEQLDWQVIVRLAAHCRRRYQRACDCRVPATVMAPGPPKAVGKGLFTNAFIAMLLVERFTAGRTNPQCRARPLHQPLQWRFGDAQQKRRAEHAFVADESNFQALGAAVGSDQRDVPADREVGMPDGSVGLLERFPEWHRYLVTRSGDPGSFVTRD